MAKGRKAKGQQQREKSELERDKAIQMFDAPPAEASRGAPPVETPAIQDGAGAGALELLMMEVCEDDMSASSSDSESLSCEVRVLLAICVPLASFDSCLRQCLNKCEV